MYNFRSINWFNSSIYPSIRDCVTDISDTASSAAADGVGARKSATKSVIVKSVSCPTADMTGVLELKTASITGSSLKAHKSSIEPPPRPTIITSKFIASSVRMPCAMLCAAFFPCTRAG